MVSRPRSSALAEAHRQLGEITLRLGRSAEARQHFDRSLRAFEALVAAGKPEPGDRRGLSVVLGRLGDVSRRQGDASEALRYYQSGLVAARASAATEPRSGRAQRGLAIAYSKLGDLARQSGNLDEARNYIRRSLAIADALARATPDAGDAFRSVAMALDELGDVERQLGDHDSARLYYRRALSVAESMAESRPDDPSSRRSQIISGNELGALLRLSGDLDAGQSSSGRWRWRRRGRRRIRWMSTRDDIWPFAVIVRETSADARETYRRRPCIMAGVWIWPDHCSTPTRTVPRPARHRHRFEQLGELHRISGDRTSADRVHREALALIEPLAEAAPDDDRRRIRRGSCLPPTAALRLHASPADRLEEQGATGSNRRWRVASLVGSGLFPPGS